MTALSGRDSAHGDGAGGLSPLAWLALQAAALWPHWQWMTARVLDGSDDPLGVVALAVLAGRVGQLRAGLRPSPRAGWLTVALGLSLVATLTLGALPPLAGALVAVLAWAAGLAAFLPGGMARLPLAGLAVLALPVLSSLQFYAGYPLRLLTAEASRMLLQAGGFQVERLGGTLQVDGLLVIVDAPCSGVQMMWLAYFTACVAALTHGLADRCFLRRLPWVSVWVLGGNMLRNTVLVVLEAHQGPVGEALHQGVGLGVLGVVCLAVALLMRGGGHART